MVVLEVVVVLILVLNVIETNDEVFELLPAVGHRALVAAASKQGVHDEERDARHKHERMLEHVND